MALQLKSIDDKEFDFGNKRNVADATKAQKSPKRIPKRKTMRTKKTLNAEHVRALFDCMARGEINAEAAKNILMDVAKRITKPTIGKRNPTNGEREICDALMLAVARHYN